MQESITRHLQTTEMQIWTPAMPPPADLLEFERVTLGGYVRPGMAGWKAARARLVATVECLLQRRDKVVFSHSTAALLAGLEAGNPWPVHVTSATNRSDSSRKVVAHHWRALPEPDVTPLANGFRTSDDRTVIDSILDLNPIEAIEICDAILRREVKPKRDARQESERAAGVVRRRWRRLLDERGPGRNVRRARVLIEMASPFAESPPESALRLWLLKCGLDSLVPQYRVDLGSQNYFVDLAILDPETGYPLLFVEYDGDAKYELDPDRTREAARQRDIERHTGVQFERFRDDVLANLDAVVERVCARLPGRVSHQLCPVLEFLPQSVQKRARRPA